MGGWYISLDALLAAAEADLSVGWEMEKGKTNGCKSIFMLPFITSLLVCPVQIPLASIRILYILVDSHVHCLFCSYKSKRIIILLHLHLESYF